MGSPLFAPDVYGPYEPLRKFTNKDIDKASSMLANESGQKLSPHRIYTSLLFKRQRKKPKTSYSLEWSNLPHKTFDRNYVTTESIIIETKDTFQEWQSYFLELCVHFESWYATCMLESEHIEKHLLNWYVVKPSGIRVESHRGVGNELYEGIPGVYWGNYFGPFLVNWFGREALMRLPCFSMQWLDTGGVFFTTAEFPDQWNTLSSLAYQKDIKAHLGKEYFFDIHTVKQMLEQLHAIPEAIKPEQLQTNRKVPDYPFEVVKPTHKVNFEEMEKNFKSLGYFVIQRNDNNLILENGKGDRVNITNIPSPTIEFIPNL